MINITKLLTDCPYNFEDECGPRFAEFLRLAVQTADSLDAIYPPNVDADYVAHKVALIATTILLLRSMPEKETRSMGASVIEHLRDCLGEYYEEEERETNRIS